MFLVITIFLSGCSKDNHEKYNFYKQHTPDNLELSREQLRKYMNNIDKENNELLHR